jgi:hypothetical protein
MFGGVAAMLENWWLNVMVRGTSTNRRDARWPVRYAKIQPRDPPRTTQDNKRHSPAKTIYLGTFIAALTVQSSYAS